MKYQDQHVYDILTCYCVKCGQHERRVEKQKCDGGGTVIGISHIVRRMKHMSTEDRMLAAAEAVHHAP